MAWGVGGLLYDAAGNTIITPGFGYRYGISDSCCHADWLRSIRFLTGIAGGEDSVLRYDAFGQRSFTIGAAHPTHHLFAGDSGYQTEYADVSTPGIGRTWRVPSL